MSVVDKMKKKTSKKKVAKKVTTTVEDTPKIEPAVAPEPKKSSLEEGMAKVQKGDKVLEVEAMHALTVMSKQGWDVVDINISVDSACAFCDNYQINYTIPPTKANLMEAITKSY